MAAVPFAATAGGAGDSARGADRLDLRLPCTSRLSWRKAAASESMGLAAFLCAAANKQPPRSEPMLTRSARAIEGVSVSANLPIFLAQRWDGVTIQAMAARWRWQCASPRPIAPHAQAVCMRASQQRGSSARGQSNRRWYWGPRQRLPAASRGRCQGSLW